MYALKVCILPMNVVNCFLFVFVFDLNGKMLFDTYELFADIRISITIFFYKSC